MSVVNKLALYAINKHPPLYQSLLESFPMMAVYLHLNPHECVRHHVTIRADAEGAFIFPGRSAVFA